MQPVLTVAEMQAVDAAAQAATPVEALIERAGTAVAVAALRLMGGAYGRRVVAVCGPGNNGADGRVAAGRLARRGARVTVVEPDVPGPLEHCDLVIDAAYGTGFRGEYRFPPVAGGTPVLAVDIPSGVGGDSGQASGAPAAAAATVTFAAWKPGLLQGDGRRLAGTATVADIGLPVGESVAAVVDDGDVALWYPRRQTGVNKWTAAVLVVAGSPGMTGAADLATRAAYRAGAGMVRLGVPGASLASAGPSEAVSVELPATGWAAPALEAAGRCRAVVVGPGLGRSEATAVAVRRLVAGSPVPVVVDADGLVALGHLEGGTLASSRSPVVLTPHDGEYARLVGDDPGPDRLAAARRLATAAGAVALLKGPTTAVAAPDGGAVLLAVHGTAALATAGTGDVLSGVIGALVARGVEPCRAAALGAHVHGRAGAAGRPEGLVAGDLPDLVAAELTGAAVGDRFRPAWADVDLAAVRHNASALAALVAPAGVCAVVKADGYGHGSVPVARAALEGGATWLAVALVEEGVALREAGIGAPVLLLSEAPAEAVAEALARRLTPTVYTATGIDVLARAAAARSGPSAPPVDVHLKVDTGMHRVGADPPDVPALADAVAAADGLRLGALWTHLAVAEGAGDEDGAFTALQVERFDAVLSTLAAAGHRPPLTHVANSAGAIAVPAARRDLVRCGIACYGVAPTPALAGAVAAAGPSLRPVLSLRTRVTYVRDLAAGERPSYGRRRPLARPSTVAVAPVGYADGVPRRLFDGGGEVLIGGVRRPLAGAVTMDQLVIDCGAAGEAPGVAVGDEVVLLGRQGAEEVTADEWAERTGTISYEVLCDIGPRVPRLVRDGDAVPA